MKLPKPSWRVVGGGAVKTALAGKADMGLVSAAVKAALNS